MPTFYMDYVNGNDANDGSSWALAWKTWITGATAARIAPGDTIREAKSPDPTSLGITATWTSRTAEWVAKNITSSTNATPIQVTANAHGLVTGDVVQVGAHTVNTNANGQWVVTKVDANNVTLDGSVGNGVGGATGTITQINCKCVKLASAVTQNIEMCETAWTVGPNVTSANASTATFKQGAYSLLIITAAGHAGAGILAQKGLPASLDLSGYQQISFWLRNHVVLASAGDLKIKLYSDAACTIEVESFDVPATPSSTQWNVVTIDKGSALSATVQGISVYANIAMPSKTFFVDNFIACKATGSADSLSLQSLISKNSLAQGGTEAWHGIQSINGTLVMLDNDVECMGNAGRGYYGTSETVETWKRETIKLAMRASTGAAGLLTPQDSGSLGSPITYSGGWNTITNLQDGDTFVDGLNGMGYGGIYCNRPYIIAENYSFVRFYIGFVFTTVSSYGCIFDINFSSNMSAYGTFINISKFNTVNLISSCNNNFHGVVINYSINDTISLNKVNNNSGYGIEFMSLVYNYNKNKNLTVSNICNNGSWGIINNNNVTVNHIITNALIEKNVSGGIINTGLLHLRNAVINDTTEVSLTASVGVRANTRTYCHNHDGTSGNHYIFTDWGQINTSIVIRHTLSGYSWQMSPLSTNRYSGYPLDFEIAKVAVNANNLVTIKAWMYRTSANLTGQLVCRGGQISGVDADVTSAVTATAAWEEITITFTPTESGAVSIEAWCWSTDLISSLYVDDMTLLQA